MLQGAHKAYHKAIDLGKQTFTEAAGIEPAQGFDRPRELEDYGSRYLPRPTARSPAEWPGFVVSATCLYRKRTTRSR